MSEEKNVNTEQKRSTWQDDYSIIGGLWKRESQSNGSRYFAGRLFLDTDQNSLEKSVVNIRIFPNRHPKHEKSFELIIYGSREDLRSLGMDSQSNKGGSVAVEDQSQTEENQSKVVVSDVSL